MLEQIVLHQYGKFVSSIIKDIMNFRHNSVNVLFAQSLKITPHSQTNAFGKKKNKNTI